MNKVVFSDKFWLELHKIKNNDVKLFGLIEKKIELFKENPRYPSLRNHKLEGRLGNYWSLSVNRSIRLIYIIDNESNVFVDIGTHDQVYKK